MLAYLSRYRHRVAISNRRLIRADANAVTFRVKDYRCTGPERYTTMTLGAHEFIRRFLTHVLPKGLHRIRHYGLFASAAKDENLSRIRDLLDATAPDAGVAEQDGVEETPTPDNATLNPARAAAASCALSRSSKPAAHRAIPRRRPTWLRLKGSIAHNAKPRR